MKIRITPKRLLKNGFKLSDNLYFNDEEMYMFTQKEIDSEMEVVPSDEKDFDYMMDDLYIKKEWCKVVRGAI
jgi:hypothetical protein